MGTLHGLEGSASRLFYEALSTLIPKRYQFEGRSRRPAKDPFNAYLNYAFAILYGKVERALVKAGVNTYLGFLHRDGHRQKSMLYDFIEPFRTETVGVVFHLFSRKQISLSEDVILKPEEGVVLTISGKKKLIGAMNEFYEDKKSYYDGIRMSPNQVINRSAREFAGILIDIAFGRPESDALAPVNALQPVKESDSAAL